MRKIGYIYPIYKLSTMSTKIARGLILKFIHKSKFKEA